MATRYNLKNIASWYKFWPLGIKDRGNWVGMELSVVLTSLCSLMDFVAALNLPYCYTWLYFLAASEISPQLYLHIISTQHCVTLWWLNTHIPWNACHSKVSTSFTSLTYHFVVVPGLISQSGRPLEKHMATHSSIVAWEVSWTEEPSGLQSIGSQRVRLRD